MKKDIELLKTFLAENGITAEFNYNLKHLNRRPVKSIEDLIKYLHRYKHPLRNAIFLAFYWNVDENQGRGISYWRVFSDKWKKKLRDQNELT